MKVLPSDNNGIGTALSILHGGGIVAHATETCYGFACDLKNPDAVMKLFKIKDRPLDQPVSALFATVSDAQRYVLWNEEAGKLANEHLPGPLTLILPVRPDAPRKLHVMMKPATSIGMRVSSNPIAQALIEKFKSPLSTTSANLHGQPNPYSPEDIQKQFAGRRFQPDLILDSGVLRHNPPSTIIDLTALRQARRSGQIQMPPPASNSSRSG